MNIFTIFFYKIVAKYTPERIKLPHFTKFSRGSMPPNPLAYKWLRHALHGTKRYANTQLHTFVLCFCYKQHNILYISPITYLVSRSFCHKYSHSILQVFLYTLLNYV